MTSNYHLTRTIPRAISTENLEKKRSHVRAVCVEVIGPKIAYGNAKSMRVKINYKLKAQKES